MASNGRGFREWINEGAGRWVTIAVCTAAIIGGGFGSWHLWRTHKDSRVTSVQKAGRTVKYFCRNCNKGGTTKVAFYADERKWPVKCPVCGQLQAYPGIRCKYCRKITERPENTLVFPCKHCGKVNDLRGGPVSDPMPAPKI